MSEWINNTNSLVSKINTNFIISKSNTLIQSTNTGFNGSFGTVSYRDKGYGVYYFEFTRISGRGYNSLGLTQNNVSFSYNSTGQENYEEILTPAIGTTGVLVDTSDPSIVRCRYTNNGIDWTGWKVFVKNLSKLSIGVVQVNSAEIKATLNTGSEPFKYDITKIVTRKDNVFSYDGSKQFTISRDKILLSLNNKAYSLKSIDTIIELSSPTIENFIRYGMDSSIKTDLIITHKNYILQIAESNMGGLFEQDISRKPLIISSMSKLAILHNGVYYSSLDGATLIPLNDSSEVETLGFNSLTLSQDIYNLVSESFKVVAYSNNEDDIIIKTTTEPFTVYDEFGDSVEVLYYTDDESATEADLILEANWSPIDDLEGVFEVAAWTDEDQPTSQRTLEMTAIPTPKFISPTTVTSIIGDLESLNIQGDGKYLLTHNNSQWFKWSGVDFVSVNIQNVQTEGMSSGEVMNADYSKWIYDKINIGVFIDNNDTVNHIGVSQLLPNKTSKLSNINFYILNTTASIDLELAGLTLSGKLSDADLTRVQYKVTLNGEPFYPTNGEFTTLSEPPQNINITMKTSDIKMMDWNTLRVDFKDFFGTEDYWQTTFVGNYASLMFKDTDGNYYSDDVGQVLQYLDFGNIVAGEVTVSHEIILKNQYGYAVKDIEIVPNTTYLPEGVLIEMSKTNDPFIPESDLLYTEGLADNEELSFFVRMNTDVNSIPNEYNKFDVFVKASRKGV